MDNIRDGNQMISDRYRSMMINECWKSWKSRIASEGSTQISGSVSRSPAWSTEWIELIWSQKWEKLNHETSRNMTFLRKLSETFWKVYSVHSSSIRTVAAHSPRFAGGWQLLSCRGQQPMSSRWYTALLWVGMNQVMSTLLLHQLLNSTTLLQRKFRPKS